MTCLKSWKLIGASVLVLGGLAACDKPGPAESAGKKIDQTVDAAGETIDQTAEAAARKIGETADKVGE